jgi:hypothetical protein
MDPRRNNYNFQRSEGHRHHGQGRGGGGRGGPRNSGGHGRLYNDGRGQQHPRQPWVQQDDPFARQTQRPTNDRPPVSRASSHEQRGPSETHGRAPSRHQCQRPAQAPVEPAAFSGKRARTDEEDDPKKSDDDDMAMHIEKKSSVPKRLTEAEYRKLTLEQKWRALVSYLACRVLSPWVIS